MSTHDAGSAELIPEQSITEPGPEVRGSPARGQSSVVRGSPAVRGQSSVVRGSPEWRQLSFRASGLTIELEITGSGDHRRLMGQLLPRQPALVEVRHADGVTVATADALGRFSAEVVPLGQISLRCRLGPDTDQSSVVTGWITI